MRTLLIVGYFYFPYGSAAAERMRSYAIAMRDKGFKVMVITSARSEDASPEWRTLGENIVYRTAFRGKSRTSALSKAIGQIGAIWNLCWMVRDISASDDFTGAIIYERRAVGILGLCLALRKARSPVMVESVEWFPATHFRFGWFNFRTWDELIGRNLILFQSWRVIAISRYIALKYQRAKRSPIIIPAVVDLGSNPALVQSTREGRPIRGAYIGALKRSDGVAVIVGALAKLLRLGIRVELELIGKAANPAAVAAIKEMLRIEPELSDLLKFRGYVDEDRKREILADCDFLLLPRLDSVEAIAAFPTRLPEMLLTGIPVITSSVGDVSVYLTDKHDVFLVRAGEEDDIVTLFCNFSKAKGNELYQEVGRRGRETAMRRFVSKAYSGTLARLFSTDEKAEAPSDFSGVIR